MQTTIQQMIDFINDINDNDRSEFNYYYDSIIAKLNELLEVEKQQIVDAIETGWVMGCSKEAGKVLHTEQYYKETYGSSTPELRYKDGTPIRKYNSPKLQAIENEIADEDIKRKIKKEYNYTHYEDRLWMVQGAIWYKEQLKKMNNK